MSNEIHLLSESEISLAIQKDLKEFGLHEAINNPEKMEGLIQRLSSYGFECVKKIRE